MYCSHHSDTYVPSYMSMACVLYLKFSKNTTTVNTVATNYYVELKNQHLNFARHVQAYNISTSITNVLLNKKEYQLNFITRKQ